MSLGCPRLGPGCPESRLDNLRPSGLRPVDGPRWHTSDGVTTATPWSSSRGGRPSGSGHTAVPEWPAAVPRAHSRTMPRLPAAPRHSARCDLLRPLVGPGAVSGSLSGSVRRKFSRPTVHLLRQRGRQTLSPLGCTRFRRQLQSPRFKGRGKGNPFSLSPFFLFLVSNVFAIYARRKELSQHSGEWKSHFSVSSLHLLRLPGRRSCRYEV